ncbi:MAG: copper amine oxidase [Arcticibacter sp.]
MLKNHILTGMLFCGFSMGVVAQDLSPANLKALKKAGRGEAVALPGFLKTDFKLIDYKKIVMPGPQYIISDDPEYIRVPEAIALKESVAPGAVRLYLYNVNGVKEPAKIDRKITAVIKNTGTAPLHLRMLKFVSQKPTTNYFQLGKQGLAEYFAATPLNEVITIAPGQVVPVDKNLENYIVKFDELVHGIYEFVIDQPAEIAVIQTAPGTPGPDAYNTIKTVLPTGHKNAGRGLFGVSNYRVLNKEVLDTKDGVSQLIVADGKIDPWVAGVEGVSGQISELAGNYGVIYDIEVDWKSSDGKGLALLTWNSRTDNQWCSGMAASMIVSEGIFKDGIVQLPSNKLTTTGAPEAVVVQVFKPAKDGSKQTIKLRYSPPGASCLPTPFIFVPVDVK